MLFQQPPSVDVVTVLNASLTTVVDRAMRSRCNALSAVIAHDEAKFITCANAGTLHLVTMRTRQDDFAVIKHDMRNLYNAHFAGRDGGGRRIYDALRMSAPNNLCLLCGAGPVAHLDHHLPKTSYPTLAVTPTNLVPACRDCNESKGRRTPKDARAQTLHPYYDDVTKDRWLRGRVTIANHGVSIAFDIEPGSTWSDALAERVRYHFKALKLASRFNVLAGSELSQIRGKLIELHRRAGANGVKAHLMEDALSRERVARNAWQTATYFALAQDNDFCSHGFDRI
jgi:5-methylcytosine-specific restriction endonuclease McrA